MDKKKKNQMIASVLAVLLCGVFYFCNNYGEKSGEIVTEEINSQESEDSVNKTVTQSPTNQEEKSIIFIHICGEVKQPGVYEFEKEPRAVEVIEKAGGFTKKADTSAINQAEVLTDGIQLVIPKKGKKKNTEQVTEEESLGKVNINTASKEELMTLTGIGESKADLILTYREENGGFQKKEDLMNITGIKEGVYSQIKDDITV